MARSRTIGAWVRRGILLILIIICAVLSVFPKRYRAAATLTPTDPSSFGLSGALAQLGAANSVFGNQAAIEVAIRVGHSIYVRDIVRKKLRLAQRLGTSEIGADRWLQSAIDIRSLRGGIVQIEYIGTDPVFARDLVAADAFATRDRLAEIARTQTEYKRHVLTQLVAEAGDRLEIARAAYDNFRRATRYSNPTSAISSIGERIPVLEASIKAKEVQIAAATRFATPSNQAVLQLEAQKSALQNQLTQARALNPELMNSVGRVVQQSTRSEKLDKDLRLAQSLYDNYTRFLLGTPVEDLTAGSSVRFLEPPFIDPSFQFSAIYASIAIGLLFLAGVFEFYGFRPPVGDDYHRTPR